MRERPDLKEIKASKVRPGQLDPKEILEQPDLKVRPDQLDLKEILDLKEQQGLKDRKALKGFRGRWQITATASTTTYLS